MSIDLITVTHSDFEPFVGETFIVETEGEPVELVLDNIKIHKTSDIRDNHLELAGVFYPPKQPFALTFEGPPEPLLESKVYSLKHEKIGRLEFFLSAFRQDQTCMLYESVFT